VPSHSAPMMQMLRKTERNQTPLPITKMKSFSLLLSVFLNICLVVVLCAFALRSNDANGAVAESV